MPDPVTASQMFQSKQVDMWGASAKDQFDLVKKGFKRQTDWPALAYPFTRIRRKPMRRRPTKLREAIDTPSTGRRWQRRSASVSSP